MDPIGPAREGTPPLAPPSPAPAHRAAKRRRQSGASLGRLVARGAGRRGSAPLRWREHNTSPCALALTFRAHDHRVSLGICCISMTLQPLSMPSVAVYCSFVTRNS